MPKMEECLIHVDLANALLDKMDPKPAHGFIGLSCPECRKPVKPMQAHFEHLARNPQCSLSD